MYIAPNDAENKAQILQSTSSDAELACILDELVAAIHRHVVMGKEAAVATALWIFHE